VICVRSQDVPDHHRAYEDLKGKLFSQFYSPGFVPAQKTTFETNGLVLADASSGKGVEESPNAHPLRKSFRSNQTVRISDSISTPLFRSREANLLSCEPEIHV
jgi:hypothetical protein